MFLFGDNKAEMCGVSYTVEVVLNISLFVSKVGYKKDFSSVGNKLIVHTCLLLLK